AHPDLVELAGGPDAVANRASEKLDAGLPVEAIQLAEIALTAEAGHRGALDVAIRAHEALERQSENFWLTQWLRKQLADLRARLASAGDGGQS
ncbi:MAG: alkyl sulfatase dimerization domain-containing protein, partial [Myxococcota bacterium]